MKTLLLIFFTLGVLLDLQARKFQVDFTVTSTEGCTFHIVGTVDMDIHFPDIANSTVNGFNGTITIGGASGCPKGTYNVSFGMVSSGNPEGGFTPEEEGILNQILWNDTRMQAAIHNINP